MSTSIQMLGPFIPTVAIAAYFLIGFIAFGVRGLLWGVIHDREIEARGNSVLVNSYLRSYFVWVVRPLWRLVLWTGVSANTITLFGAALGLLSGVAVAYGHFAFGGWALLFSGMLDAFDGRLARERGEVSAAGSAIDSVLDRYVDAAILIGLAWYFRGSWTLLPTLAALLGTSIVPYVRARGDGLGVEMKDGLMQRPERILYLGVPMALSPLVEVIWYPPSPHPPHRLAAVAVTFLAIMSNVTAMGRFVRLIAALHTRAEHAPTRRDITLPDITRRDIRPHVRPHRG
jgi:phosphatidylglycerophosphate synthase